MSKDRWNIALEPAGGHCEGSRHQGMGKDECQKGLGRQ